MIKKIKHKFKNDIRDIKNNLLPAASGSAVSGETSSSGSSSPNN